MLAPVTPPATRVRSPSSRVPPASARPSRPASFLSGRMATRLPPPWTQALSMATCPSDSDAWPRTNARGAGGGHLPVGRRRGAEAGARVGGEGLRAARADVRDVELVEPLAAQDLGQVAAEAVGVGGDDEDRPSGGSGDGRRGRPRRDGGEGERCCRAGEQRSRGATDGHSGERSACHVSPDYFGLITFTEPLTVCLAVPATAVTLNRYVPAETSLPRLSRPFHLKVTVVPFALRPAVSVRMTLPLALVMASVNLAVFLALKRTVNTRPPPRRNVLTLTSTFGKVGAAFFESELLLPPEPLPPLPGVEPAPLPPPAPAPAPGAG